MEPDELVAAAEAAARNARRLVTLTLIAVFVAIVVLGIDNSIKRSIISEAGKMRRLLDELRALMAEKVVADGQAAGQGGTGSGAGSVGADRVAGTAGTSTDPDPDAGGGRPAPRRGQVGSERRPGGDG